MAIKQSSARDPFTGQYPGAKIETKEFFRTSEFWFTVVTAMMLMLSALSLPNLDGRWTATLVTILVAAYTLGRGIAKAGSAHPYQGPASLLQNLNDEPDEIDEHDELLRRVEARLAMLENAPGAPARAQTQRVVL